MKKLLQKFKLKEDGAVSVDWVVLTAAMTVLASAGIVATQSGVNVASAKVSAHIADDTVR